MMEPGMQIATESNRTAFQGTGGTVVFEVREATPRFQFRHRTLPDPKTYIRLLELGDVKIGDTTTELSCKVTTWHVDHAPSYHAISYVWGDPRVTTTIEVDGNNLQITTNGDYALRQARWLGVRYVWMDSICIDQYDAKEKGHQVGMMGNIYRRASCVLSCVGPHSENSELLMRIPSKLFIPNHESKYRSQKFIPYISGSSRRFLQTLNLLAWLVQTQDVKKETVLNSLFSFMKRPYFTRLWVLQEVSMTKIVIVCCGIGHRPIAELYALHSMLHYVLLLGSKSSSWKRLIATVLFPYATLSQILESEWGYSHRSIGRIGCLGYCGNGNVWTLGCMGDIGTRVCMIHENETYCRQRFSFENLEDMISKEYIQVKGDEDGLMALLPQGTQSGDLLLTLKGIFDRGGKQRGPRYLVLRRLISKYYSIVGQAIVAGGCKSIDKTFGKCILYLDDRDALNLTISWAQCPAYEKQNLSLMTWDMAKELLDLKVCNLPLSSYAEFT
ncbi:hypothetical protein OCU04_011264 [Sclerotinia nivalis]|uniref:Heterokaryon incompatibility domain-containing protein n=1 Tax=Sclerotinia nivalis TaxID=352851 RepID=A0A9X0AB35_9HELO|nr:hypothetical protein OCU04_011264 [Sclerotinia nivalis]